MEDDTVVLIKGAVMGAVVVLATGYIIRRSKGVKPVIVVNVEKPKPRKRIKPPRTNYFAARKAHKKFVQRVESGEYFDGTNTNDPMTDFQFDYMTAQMEAEYERERRGL